MCTTMIPTKDDDDDCYTFHRIGLVGRSVMAKGLSKDGWCKDRSFKV